ncbi:MAG TPA: hypothetical protein VJG32_15275 [Anaerolineae bacterium]|nr:hypothetical protein [Anaerolineae bacterium]
MFTQPAPDTSVTDAPVRRQDEVAFMAAMPVIVANGASPTRTETPGASRLLVLVPDLEVDEVDLAQCVWSLAEPRSLPVFYLGISDAPFRESPIRRRLATLAAITRDNRIQVETRYLPVHNWLEAVEVTCQPGDLIVSPPDRALARQSNGQRSGRRAISTVTRMPVHVLPEFLFDRPSEDGRRRRDLVFWPISLMILAGFFWLQAQIDHTTQDLLRTLLLSLSVLVEGGVLIFWHSLTS